jgi:ACS family glucarate transporter-like MFS transporter/ACS family D-galactonate transporter-like MFS transporter
MSEPQSTDQSPSARPTVVRFAVLAWLCAAAALAYVSRNAIGVAESTVRGDLGLTREQSGWLMSAFFISYAVCQIPGAWVGQRFGARRALPVFAVAWSLATSAMAAGSFLILIVARAAKGLSQAGLFPVCTGVVAHWFPGTGRALATGALASFMSVGGAAGAALTGWLVVEIGWRWMFALYSLPGLLWAAWFWTWFRNTPSEHRSVNAAEQQLIERSESDAPANKSSPPATSLFSGVRPSSGAETREGSAARGISNTLDSAELAATEDGRTPINISSATARPNHGNAPVSPPTPWRQLLTSPAMWCIGGQQFFRAAGYMFFTSWFATYLQESRGVTIAQSGLLTMLPLLSVVAGSLAGGAVSDAVLRRTGSLRLARQALAGCSLVLCAALTLAACFFADALVAVLIISAGSFFAAVAGPCGYTITIDMGGEHVPTVNSVMNMCGNVGAMLFPLAVPWLLRETGSWNAVLFSFGALYIAGAICWWCLKPEGSVFTQALCDKR